MFEHTNALGEMFTIALSCIPAHTSNIMTCPTLKLHPNSFHPSRLPFWVTGVVKAAGWHKLFFGVFFIFLHCPWQNAAEVEIRRETSAILSYLQEAWVTHSRQTYNWIMRDLKDAGNLWLFLQHAEMFSKICKLPRLPDKKQKCQMSHQKVFLVLVDCLA